MEDHAGNIRENIKRIRERLAAAAKRSGRTASAITLLAVTKKVAIPEIRMALDAGIKVIGENKVQEAKSKFSQIGPAAAWHMIGHVQTNKARHAAAIFDMIESVDSRRVADALDHAAGSLDRELNVLIEINISGEDQKYGVPPDQAEALAAYVAAKPNLRLRGLMAMAPYVDDTELIRPAFRRMAEIFAAQRAHLPARVAWDVLSMGMTHDFEVAIEEGSTLVRVGTGIFGARAEG